MPPTNTPAIEDWMEEKDGGSKPEQLLSAWATSRAKRIFDVVLVLVFAPALVPLLLTIVLVIFMSSGTPILFRQTRIGRGGLPFTIYKFRTMCLTQPTNESTIAALSPGQIIPPGRVLRRLKLDELPQVFNVLTGKMSLVGPRPKIPEQQLATLSCRPGLTGTATLAFAREDALFARIPRERLADYYRTVVLPIKREIDTEYMARASLLSDLRILFNTVTGRWGYVTKAVSSKVSEIRPPSFHSDAYGAQSLE